MQLTPGRPPDPPARVVARLYKQGRTRSFSLGCTAVVLLAVALLMTTPMHSGHSALAVADVSSSSASSDGYWSTPMPTAAQLAVARDSDRGQPALTAGTITRSAALEASAVFDPGRWEAIGPQPPAAWHGPVCEQTEICAGQVLSGRLADDGRAILVSDDDSLPATHIASAARHTPDPSQGPARAHAGPRLLDGASISPATILQHSNPVVPTLSQASLNADAAPGSSADSPVAMPPLAPLAVLLLTCVYAIRRTKNRSGSQRPTRPAAPAGFCQADAPWQRPRRTSSHDRRVHSQRVLQLRTATRAFALAGGVA